MSVVLTIALWVVWALLVAAGLFLATVFLAFGGDASRANKALQRAIPPAFNIAVVALLASLVLMILGRWWSVVLAYLLALTPPLTLAVTTTRLLNRPNRTPDHPPSPH